MTCFPPRPVLAAVLLLSLSGAGQRPHRAASPLPPRAAALAQQRFETTAADCAHPFGLREGQEVEYRLLNAKGRPTGSWRCRVVSIRTDTTGKKSQRVATTRVLLKSGLYDPSNLVLQQQDLTFFCRRDTTFTDGLAEINYEGLRSFRDRRLAFEGVPLPWPHQPAAGARLAGGGATVRVSSPMVAIASVKTTLSQRRVLAGPAPVTVPAGTFSCFVVESQRELATAARADLVLKSGGRQVDYYDPAVGIVKTEYYDKGGKLLQSRVLARR